MEQKVIEFDELLSQYGKQDDAIINSDMEDVVSVEEEDFDNEKPKRKRRTKSDAEILAASKKKKETINLAGSASVNLSRSAKEVLKSYINQSPKYKVIKQELQILNEKLIEYKKAGATEYYEICKTHINELLNAKKKFEKIIKPKTQSEINGESEELKKSPKLKELKQKRKELEQAYADLNPNTLYEQIRRLRELLNKKEEIMGSYEDEITEEVEEDEIVSIDDLIKADSNKLTLKEEYKNLCFYIGELTGHTDKEIEEMSTSEIRRILKQNMSEEDKNKLKKVKQDLINIKFETSNEIKRIKGYSDITDIMYDMFDMQTEEKAPKEMLAASKVSYVQSIAYNQCARLNKLHYYEDAVGYGLLGLTNAINKWYEVQKLKNSAVTFETFGYLYIANTIKRGLYTLSSGGVQSGSSLATAEHYRKNNVKRFIQENEELKDLPEDMIADILEAAFPDDKKSVMSETEYNQMVGGDEADASIFSNKIGTGDEDSLSEVKAEYENLIKALKQLFSLFETKVDKDGNRIDTDKKVFTKFDYQLFLMSTGLVEKYNPATGVKEEYTQGEMAKELEKMYRENGQGDKTFSQAAISTRIKKIYEKIRKIMELKPEIKKAFEYLLYYVKANKDNINIISNKRESLGISLDLNESLCDTIYGELKNFE